MRAAPPESGEPTPPASTERPTERELWAIVKIATALPASLMLVTLGLVTAGGRGLLPRGMEPLLQWLVVMLPLFALAEVPAGAIDFLNRKEMFPAGFGRRLALHAAGCGAAGCFLWAVISFLSVF